MTTRKWSFGLILPASVLLLSLLQVGPGAWIERWMSSHLELTSLLRNSTGRSTITKPYICAHEYTIEVISFDPMVIYLNNFVTDAEIRHLLEIGSTDQWSDSMVFDAGFAPERRKQMRSSQSATIAPTDRVAKCLARRMKSLMGNLQHDEVEIQLVKYGGGDQYLTHHDWFTRPFTMTCNTTHPDRLYNRLMSIFVYLESNCTGGETYFPEIEGVGPHADGEKFSRTESGEGLLFKPRRGSGIMWINLFMNGTGDPRVSHAGLPVKSGRKVGLNLWSIYYLDRPIITGYG